MESTSVAGSRLRAERLSRQLTLRQFDRLTEISYTLLSRYENGLIPPLKDRERIAKELGVNPEFLWPTTYGIQGVA